tara:strand:- start:11 stop:850 length:840 start_codon:yes stop_codon:yes gene_type:complete
MAQQEFNPVPGVSTNADCEAVINSNATDAEERLSELATPSVLSKSGSYTILPGDAGKTITSTSSSALSFTLTDSVSFATGATVEIVQEAEGALTIAEGAGTTINRSRFAALELGGRYSTVRLRKQSAGIWIASGDLKEEPPRAEITLSASQSKSGNNVILDIDSISNQAPSECFSLSGSNINCLIGGVYTFSGHIRIKSTDTGANRTVGVRLSIDGTTTDIWSGTREVSDTSNNTCPAVAGIERIEAGQVVTIRTISSGTTTTDSDARYNKVWAQRISD